MMCSCRTSAIVFFALLSIAGCSFAQIGDSAETAIPLVFSTEPVPLVIDNSQMSDQLPLVAGCEPFDTVGPGTLVYRQPFCGSDTWYQFELETSSRLTLESIPGMAELGCVAILDMDLGTLAATRTWITYCSFLLPAGSYYLVFDQLLQESYRFGFLESSMLLSATNLTAQIETLPAVEINIPHTIRVPASSFPFTISIDNWISDPEGVLTEPHASAWGCSLVLIDNTPNISGMLAPRCGRFVLNCTETDHQEIELLPSPILQCPEEQDSTYVGIDNIQLLENTTQFFRLQNIQYRVFDEEADSLTVSWLCCESQDSLAMLYRLWEQTTVPREHFLCPLSPTLPLGTGQDSLTFHIAFYPLVNNGLYSTNLDGADVLLNYWGPPEPEETRLEFEFINEYSELDPCQEVIEEIGMLSALRCRAYSESYQGTLRWYVSPGSPYAAEFWCEQGLSFNYVNGDLLEPSRPLAEAPSLYDTHEFYFYAVLNDGFWTINGNGQKLHDPLHWPSTLQHGSGESRQSCLPMRAVH